MSDPAWSRNAYEDAQNFFFPNPQTFTDTSGGNAQITVPSPIPASATYFEIKITTAPGGQYCVGIVSAAYSGPNIRQNYNSGSAAQSAWVAENGAVFSNATYSGYSLSALASGSVVGVYVNAAQTGVAFTLNGTSWNNGSTTAQIVAGTGLLAIGSWGTLVPLVSMSAANGQMEIFASAANCAHALPTGATYLAANTALNISSMVVVPGINAVATWSDLNGVGVSSLQYELGSALGTWVSGSGGTTGTSGTVTLTGTTGFTPSQFAQAAIRDPANALASSALYGFIVLNPPAHVGTLVGAITGAQNVEIDTTFSQTLTLSPTIGTYVFDFEWQFVSGTPNGNYSFDMLANSGGQINITGGGGSPSTQYGISSQTPTTGPSSVTFTRASTVSGTVTLAQSGTNIDYSAAFSNNGTAVTYNNILLQGGTVGNVFTNLVVSFNANFQTQQVAYAGAVWELPSESITITTITDVPGMPAVLSGVTNQGPATAQDWTDNPGAGAIWTPLAGYTYSAGSTNTAWSGTGPILDTGTTTVFQTRDHNTLTVLSNLYTLVLAPSIELNQITALPNVAPVVSGTDGEFPEATSMDLQIGVVGGTLGTWTKIAGFNPALSYGGPWFGEGIAEPAGTYTAQVRNTAIPGNLSNIVTYTIQGGPYRVGLFQSDVTPSDTDTYVEFSAYLAWTWQTVLVPDNQQLQNNAIIRSSLAMEFIGDAPVVTVTALDNGNNVLKSVMVTPTGGTSVWDGVGAESTWDLTPWDGVPSPLSPWWLMWTGPIVFKQASFMATGQSSVGYRIGNLYSEYRVLGYVQQTPSGVN